MSATAPTAPTAPIETKPETKRTPVERIRDSDLTTLLKSHQARIYLDIVKSKKKGEPDLYSQTFQWVDTKTPVLTRDGCIDCTGTALFGVHEPAKRNTGKFGKPDGPYDECDMTFGTKFSGTFGELMCEINDRAWPEAVNEFTQRPDQKDLWVGHEIDPHQFCKKNAGSLTTPASPEVQAAYVAAADWSFPVKLKIEKRTKTGEISNKPFMFKVVKYVLNNKGIPVEQEVKINSQTIHKELTRNSKLMLCMRPGNCTMKSAAFKGSVMNTFFPAFNFGHITILKKGEAGGTMSAQRSPEEIRAALAAAGVELTMGSSEQEDQDADGEDPDEPASGVETPAASFKPGATAASGEDLAKQFASMNA